MSPLASEGVPVPSRCVTARRALAVVALAVPLALAPAVDARAASYAWRNTEHYAGSQTLRVQWCAGGTGSIRPDTRTSKDVCGFFLRYNTEIDVWVKETGTTLYDGRAYCGPGSGVWIILTSRTDTSRTAQVGYYAARCA